MIAGCLLAAGALPVWGQSGAPTLVIRIDDLGALHSVNEACIQTYRSGIARSVEVMPVAAWYPEAIKMLRENPGLDVGLHLVITSEWENVKWRPLTHCPSLTDENGYFYPMMFPNPAYPGQSIMEQKWDIKEIEQEFRAQIETTLKSIPQLSHLSGHMLSTGFSKEVNELVQRLAKEYNLPSIDRMDSSKDYRFTYIGYDGPKRTAEEKEASFIKALEKLQPGQRYLFLDHPALDNDEMKTVFHIPPKKETAYLLAQSLVCRESGFACEVCDTCERIAHNEYADMIYLDGTSVSIKKDDILKLQHAFAKTGLEKTGKKIYVLDHAENATPDALNSLLKFLEEPGSDMIAILIVEQLDRVLPTIISRCQNIPFTPLSASQCHAAVQEDLEALDAYLLSSMIRQKSEILEASESEDYQHARFLMKGMLERYLSSPYDALLFLQLEGFPSKQKKHGKQAMLYLLDMLTIFFRDCLRGSRRQSDTWYQNMLKEYQKKNMDMAAILQILMQTKDTLLRSVNLQLLVDQMLYRMKEVTE